MNISAAVVGELKGNVTGNLTGNIDLNSGITRHTYGPKISNSTNTDVLVNYVSNTNQTNKHKLTFIIDQNDKIQEYKILTIQISNILGVTVDECYLCIFTTKVIITHLVWVRKHLHLKLYLVMN